MTPQNIHIPTVNVRPKLWSQKVIFGQTHSNAILLFFALKIPGLGKIPPPPNPTLGWRLFCFSTTFNGYVSQFNTSYFAATYPATPVEREDERVIQSHSLHIFWDIIGCVLVSIQSSSRLFHIQLSAILMKELIFPTLLSLCKSFG